jgi:hypothetical protein
MNKKSFYISILLVFVLILSGCAGYPTTPRTSTNEEAKIRIVINEYFLAINNQNWNKARSYCLYGGNAYYATSQMESLANSLYMYCYVVTINFTPNILNVSVSGNYAQAYFYLYGTVSACGYFESDSSYTTYYLQKIGNSWKLS